MSHGLATNLKIGFVVVATLGLYTLVANSIPQLESEVPEELSFGADVTPDELVAAGEQLYNGAGGCVACHGLGQRAPNLLTDEAGTGTIGVRCATRVPGEDCKTYLHESMVNPTAYLVEGFEPIMPDMSRILTENQVWAIVAYLQAQGGEVTVTSADLDLSGGGAGPAAGGPTGGAPSAGGGALATTSTEPLEIMRANQCFACHILGEEGIELGPPLNDIGARKDAAYIRNSILNPGAEAAEGYEELLGVMMVNLADRMTARQLEILVDYLASQR